MKIKTFFSRFFLLGIFCSMFFLTYSLSHALEYKTITDRMGRDMMFNKKNPNVKYLQQILNELGYSVAESGPGSSGQEYDKFDDKLKNALIEFQKENEIKVTGKLDAPTLKVLNELIVFLKENMPAGGNGSDNGEENTNSFLGNGGKGLDKDYLKDVSIQEQSIFGGSADVSGYVTDLIDYYTPKDSLINEALKKVVGAPVKKSVPTQKFKYDIFDCFLDYACSHAK